MDIIVLIGFLYIFTSIMCWKVVHNHFLLREYEKGVVEIRGRK